MDSSADRRAFLGRLAAAGLAASLPTTAHGSPERGAPPAGEWDDEWTQRVRAAKHRAVFDAPDPADGLALTQAWIYQQGYQDALGAPPADLARVVVMRHHGVVVAFGDAMWAKYGIGEWQKIDDPATGKPAVRNPWATPWSGGQAGTSMAELRATGTIFLACSLALNRRADQLANRAGADPAAVRAELRSNLVPGVILQPSGVYATARAQEMGCVFMRST
jgi:hypothetical protein